MARAQQVKVRRVSVKTIMRAKEFRRGLDDVRAGVPFDWTMDSWEYERGRLFGCIAPIDMPLYSAPGKLNPQAVTLYGLASERRLIT